MTKGKFYVIEGIDGAGKTSVLNELIKIPELDGLIAVTHEPYSQKYKDLISNSKRPRERALLFALDRAYHIKHVIEPLLEKYQFVFCDRFMRRLPAKTHYFSGGIQQAYT